MENDGRNLAEMLFAMGFDTDSETFDTHVRSMRGDGVWASTFELLMLAIKHSINTEIVTTMID